MKLFKKDYYDEKFTSDNFVSWLKAKLSEANHAHKTDSILSAIGLYYEYLESKKEDKT